jgi:stage III sporulation protein AF
VGWLSSWIKELILIILVAVFADLLLPSHALQRYVRTIIGLFILLVLLSPIFEFFHKNWNADRLVQAALDAQNTDKATMQPLSAIVRQSDELKADNQKQAKQLLEQQIGANIKAGIENQALDSVQSVEVITQIDGNGKPTITSIHVFLSANNVDRSVVVSSSVEQEKSNPIFTPIESIKPVVIEIQPDFQKEKKKAASTPPMVSDMRKSQIKQYIEQQWQVKANQISVD